MELPKEQYEQMASEISGASVSIWTESLKDEDIVEGITLDDLWRILNKYIKPKDEDNNDERDKL